MISASFNDGYFYIQFSYTDNFNDIKEWLSDSYAVYNKKTKEWKLGISKWKDFRIFLFSIEEPLEIDYQSELNYKDYIDNFSELKTRKERFSVDYSNMNYQPLIGKHPFESYQSDDIRAALAQNRYLFNWEMGLGKSYCLAVLLENLFSKNKIDKALICTSGVGSLNLKSELLYHCKSFTSDDIIVFSNAKSFKKKEDRAIFSNNQKIIITTYDTMKTIMDYYNSLKKKASKDYLKCPFDFSSWGNIRGLFLDECHLISTPSTRRTQIFLQLIHYFEYRYLFTGTLADKYEKLYIPCKILDRALVHGESYHSWLSNYVTLGNRFSKYEINTETWNLDKIQALSAKLLSSYGSKRMIKDCLNLPPDFEKTINIDMSEKHRTIYELFSNESFSIIEKLRNEESFSNSILNRIHYFQSIVDNPKLVMNSKFFDLFSDKLKTLLKSFSYEKDYKKLEILDTIIEERATENNQKGIIWYFHPMTKDSLVEYYKKYNPYIIEAGMGYESIFKIVEEFKKSDSKILIASVNIMNTSLTLTECKWQIYLENTFKFVDYQQSRGRIFRPSQKDCTTTYFIVYNSSIDGFQMDNLRNKGHTLDTLMNMKYISPSVWKNIFNFNIGDKL